jgi:hypothetical protein
MGEEHPYTYNWIQGLILHNAFAHLVAVVEGIYQGG